MKKLIFILMAMLLFTLPKPAVGQVFPADRHTLQNGVYEIYYSTSALDAVRNYNIYVMAKLPGSQPFFLSSVAGDMENIRGKEGEKIVMWSPILEGKTPDNYSFEIHAIDSRILAARQEVKKFDIKDGFGKVKFKSNVENSSIKLNNIVINSATELTLPAGTYRFTAEAESLPQIAKDHIVKKDQHSTVLLNFVFGYLTVFVNKKDGDIGRILVKPEQKTYAHNFGREIKQAIKHRFPTGNYTVSTLLYDGSKKNVSMNLKEGESKTLRIDFAKMDIPGYEWVKEIEWGVGRFFSEPQVGVLVNEDYNGFTLSIPFGYMERRAPVEHGIHFTGSFAFVESIGYMFASSKYRDLSGLFVDCLTCGLGMDYAFPDLYSLSAMVKGGLYAQPCYEEKVNEYDDYLDTMVGGTYLDVDFALKHILKKRKNLRLNLRFRLFDGTKESKRHTWSVHQGTIFINFGYSFYEAFIPLQ
ncbi:MAG: hypothetical protein PHC50_05860 [Candidatus Cloacimonetes bacterium]|nr:hypothetical protein [Candidatus Cloacimonadota bacterium]